MTARLVLLASALAACGAPTPSPVGPVRFVNADPVWLVNDRRDVPAPPEERKPRDSHDDFHVSVYRRFTRLLEARPRRRALGVNSVGEVPTSTWFENRIGVRDVPIAELIHGPGDNRGLDLSRPLRVVRGKSEGLTAGFQAEDASGTRWLIKFEFKGLPAAESSTDIVVQRLLWLVGYRVSENHIAFLRRDQIVLAEDATVKDLIGHKRPMTAADLDRVFAAAAIEPDGRYRVLASKFLAGKPLGGAPLEGVRADDPNDTIPHERRRELRGLKIFAGWLQHTDFKELGTLDMWQEDPLRPGRHAVFHYLVDYGKSLGIFGRNAQRPADGHAELLDGQYALSAFTLGLWTRPWEGTAAPPITAVGRYDVEHYDPIAFTPATPYTPFLDTDDLDAFWAVRILLRITPAHLRAALELGQYPDPRAIDYLLRVMIGRQRKTARVYLHRVSPLDEIAVSPGENEGARVCFVDLLVRHRLDPAGRYRATAYDSRGRALGAGAAIAADAGGRGCAAVPLGRGQDAYTIVRLDVMREGRALPPVEAHIARGPHGLRVVGIDRAMPRN